ncbi:MAG: polymer-forming cytoskeletal protein [Halobacteriota archaeon]|nr:polymer-forming cytoskeletal protein [Halobacteriota archaeon]
MIEIEEEEIKDLLSVLVIPDNTRIEENNIVVDGDILIGNYADIGYGILARSVIAGERTNISGSVDAEGDVRIDLWSTIKGNVISTMDAYLGESVKILGKLTVYGDLDIGNDVLIEEGFEARGLIAIRNPLPVIVYIMVYLSELLRLGRSEEVEKFIEELFEDDYLNLSDNSMIVPNRTKMDYGNIQVSTRGIIGNNCRLVGNIKLNSLSLGANSILFGSIRTRDETYIGPGSIVHGDIVSKNSVYVDAGAHILGKIRANHIKIHEEASVDGSMMATNGVNIIKDDEEEIKDIEEEEG